MPLPAHDTIVALGRRVKRLAEPLPGLDALVGESNRTPRIGGGDGWLTSKKPRKSSKPLGMPPAQHNQMAGMTLIALCGLTPDDAWSAAERRRCTVTKGIMDYLKEHYDTDYAPNTR